MGRKRKPDVMFICQGCNNWSMGSIKCKKCNAEVCPDCSYICDFCHETFDARCVASCDTDECVTNACFSCSRPCECHGHKLCSDCVIKCNVCDKYWCGNWHPTQHARQINILVYFATLNCDLPILEAIYFVSKNY